MGYRLVRNVGLLLLCWGLLVLASGCETIGAARNGDLKKEDIILMAQLRTRPSRGFQQGSRQDQAGSWNWMELDFVKADSWIQQNLW